MKIHRNPLLIKELREEVRSRRIFFIVPVYIAILSTIALVAVGSSSGTSFNPIQLAGTSRYTMYAFVIAISIFLGLISIVFGAASFTTEREKATYELLELTPLSYTDLVLGKFMHAFILVALILISSLPVLSTLFFMGGLSYLDFVLTFVYLMVFLAFAVLVSIAISVVSTRTIVSMIVGLGIAFAGAVTLATMSGPAFRDPGDMGFAALSPWLVIWRQIFSPVPLKIAGYAVPVWPVYILLYALLGLLPMSSARNALDSRKLERNHSTRLLALLFFNFYFAIGILCMHSYRPVVIKDINELYQVILVFLVITLPLFAIGNLNEKEVSEFERRPILSAFSPSKIFLNYPVSGISFLIVLLYSVSITIALTTGLRLREVLFYPTMLLSWILPWMFLFIALRLFRVRGRAIFAGYILGVLLYTLAGAFYHGNKASSSYEFLFSIPLIVMLLVIALTVFMIAWFRNSRRRAAV